MTGERIVQGVTGGKFGGRLMADTKLVYRFGNQGLARTLLQNCEEH